ncbi:Uncharacterized protein TPAR_04643 [Tolypocladium paradoxum]|uniref:Uncharacterized protein n=1 Tax=Tolypocladium paradoxum TaxID=94208 RepID=A0A2S4KY98_9HYPO|nr:Uncharacterized protein TPAR_04643 [Tolypocladium paradoxum]
MHDNAGPSVRSSATSNKAIVKGFGDMPPHLVSPGASQSRFRSAVRLPRPRVNGHLFAATRTAPQVGTSESNARMSTVSEAAAAQARSRCLYVAAATAHDACPLQRLPQRCFSAGVYAPLQRQRLGPWNQCPTGDNTPARQNVEWLMRAAVQYKALGPQHTYTSGVLRLLSCNARAGAWPCRVRRGRDQTRHRRPRPRRRRQLHFMADPGSQTPGLARMVPAPMPAPGPGCISKTSSSPRLASYECSYSYSTVFLAVPTTCPCRAPTRSHHDDAVLAVARTTASPDSRFPSRWRPPAQAPAMKTASAPGQVPAPQARPDTTLPYGVHSPQSPHPPPSHRACAVGRQVEKATRQTAIPWPNYQHIHPILHVCFVHTHPRSRPLLSLLIPSPLISGL